jgi:NTE family protein
MPKIDSPYKVEYLTFEGGGGKGVAYLGAVQALEELHVLPIDKSSGRNQVKGISGASAGAITALLVAMGMNSDQLINLIVERADEFKKFFDGPASGVYRAVSAKYVPYTKGDTPAGHESRDFQLRRADALPISGGGLAVVLWLLRIFFGVRIDDDVAAISAVRRNLAGYLYNLFYDRGLFPGLSVRAFVSKWINAVLDRYLEPEGLRGKGGELDFQTFYRLTGVDLVVTGTNVTKMRSMYFSKARTPRFPVAEAVGISMNFPLLFKPIWLDGPSDYVGYWVDGGVLNNLPIHAFDDESQSLNPKLLAFRLADGWRNREDRPADVRSQASVLWDYLALLKGSFTFPANDGQFRSPSERSQSIDLFTQQLTLIDFAPTPDSMRGSIQDAHEAVLRYFNVQ